jgi:hypothetical protein
MYHFGSAIRPRLSASRPRRAGREPLRDPERHPEPGVHGLPNLIREARPRSRRYAAA